MNFRAIPRHRPPFGVTTILRAVLSHDKAASIEAIENIYTETFGLYGALLPSARAGICWALKSQIGSGATIVGPAYTCQVVHEAIVRAGCQFRLFDTDGSSYLMDFKSIPFDRLGNYAIVLCEMYGYSYESHSFPRKPQMQIIDAAMTLPTPQVFERARDNDCVMLSFGIGKCLYSGFGGIVLSKNKELVREIRNRRDANLCDKGLLSTVMRCADIILRTAAHERAFYRYSSRFRKPHSELQNIPLSWKNDTNHSEEWYMSSTYVDRKLAMYNLEQSADMYMRRIDLARRYHINLANVPGIAHPDLSHYAMSHYTIRVCAGIRDLLRTALQRLGVDTGTLYRFPSYLSRSQYPNAARTGNEVINLPLDASLTSEDVDYICDCIVQCLSRIWSDSEHTERESHALSRMQGLSH